MWTPVTLLATAVLQATTAASGLPADPCAVYSEDFDLFSDPQELDDGQFRVTWCTNGADIAGSSFCPTGGALRLDADGDEPVVTFGASSGSCATVTLRFDYGQILYTGSVVWFHLFTGGDEAHQCNAGIFLAGFLDVAGGQCTQFEHTIDLLPGQSVAWRIDHGSLGTAALFIDQLEIEAAGACCDDKGGGGHDCCDVGFPSCENAAIAECVCAIDPFCCEVAWDEQCVEEVEQFGCGTCAGTGSNCATAFGADFGALFQTGSVCSIFPEQFESCEGTGPFISSGTPCAGSGDMAMTFASGFPHSAAVTPCFNLGDGAQTATVSFSYTKPTASIGPRVDVSIADGAFETIWTAPVASAPQCVRQTIDLTAWLGQDGVRLRFASGSSVSSGVAIDDIVVAISDQHDCCEAGGPGCADDETAECVCAVDPFCCDVEWDELCVLGADLYGCAECGSADLDGNGTVGFGDLLVVLSGWGPCPGGCAGDLDLDEIVGFPDLLIILTLWG